MVLLGALLTKIGLLWTFVKQKVAQLYTKFVGVKIAKLIKFVRDVQASRAARKLQNAEFVANTEIDYTLENDQLNSTIGAIRAKKRSIAKRLGFLTRNMITILLVACGILAWMRWTEKGQTFSTKLRSLWPFKSSTEKTAKIETGKVVIDGKTYVLKPESEKEPEATNDQVTASSSFETGFLLPFSFSGGLPETTASSFSNGNFDKEFADIVNQFMDSYGDELDVSEDVVAKFAAFTNLLVIDQDISKLPIGADTFESDLNCALDLSEAIVTSSINSISIDAVNEPAVVPLSTLCMDENERGLLQELEGKLGEIYASVASGDVEAVNNGVMDVLNYIHEVDVNEGTMLSVDAQLRGLQIVTMNMLGENTGVELLTTIGDLSGYDAKLSTALRTGSSRKLVP